MGHEVTITSLKKPRISNNTVLLLQNSNQYYTRACCGDLTEWENLQWLKISISIASFQFAFKFPCTSLAVRLSERHPIPNIAEFLLLLMCRALTSLITHYAALVDSPPGE